MFCQVCWMCLFMCFFNVFFHQKSKLGWTCVVLEHQLDSSWTQKWPQVKFTPKESFSKGRDEHHSPFWACLHHPIFSTSHFPETNQLHSLILSLPQNGRKNSWHCGYKASRSLPERLAVENGLEPGIAINRGICLVAVGVCHPKLEFCWTSPVGSLWQFVQVGHRTSALWQVIINYLPEPF